MSIDLDMMRLLQSLPLDLVARGWEWDRAESSHDARLASTYFVAVYLRPFARDVDPEECAYHRKGSWFLRVSTEGHRCESWDAAHQQAIALMRAADTSGPV